MSIDGTSECAGCEFAKELTCVFSFRYGINGDGSGEEAFVVLWLYPVLLRERSLNGDAFDPHFEALDFFQAECERFDLDSEIVFSRLPVVFKGVFECPSGNVFEFLVDLNFAIDFEYEATAIVVESLETGKADGFEVEYDLVFSGAFYFVFR